MWQITKYRQTTAPILTTEILHRSGGVDEGEQLHVTDLPDQVEGALEILLRLAGEADDMDAEYQTLSSEKNGFYTRYKKAQIELRELRTAQQNVEAFFRKEERNHAVPQQEVK